METKFEFLERRITEETIRALMADSDRARDSHLGLLRLYRDRLATARRVADEDVRNRYMRDAA